MINDKIVEFKSCWHKEILTLNANGLTELEIKVLIGSRNSDFSDIFESDTFGDWSFSVCDAAGLTESVYRGVVSSLIKKGYVEIFGTGSEATFCLTDKGKSLFGVKVEGVKL